MNLNFIKKIEIKNLFYLFFVIWTFFIFFAPLSLSFDTIDRYLPYANQFIEGKFNIINEWTPPIWILVLSITSFFKTPINFIFIKLILLFLNILVFKEFNLFANNFNLKHEELILSNLFFFIFPLFLILSASPMSDVFLTYLFLLFLKFYIKKKYLISGLFGLLLILTKFTLILIIPVLILDLIFKKKRNLKTILISSLGILWNIKNYFLFNSFFPASSAGKALDSILLGNNIILGKIFDISKLDIITRLFGISFIISDNLNETIFYTLGSNFLLFLSSIMLLILVYNFIKNFKHNDFTLNLFFIVFFAMSFTISILWLTVDFGRYLLIVYPILLFTSFKNIGKKQKLFILFFIFMTFFYSLYVIHYFRNFEIQALKECSSIIKETLTSNEIFINSIRNYYCNL